MRQSTKNRYLLLALCLAIDWESTVLDSLRLPSHHKPRKWPRGFEQEIRQIRRNIKMFERLKHELIARRE